MNGQRNLYDNLFYRLGFTPSRFQELCQKVLMADSTSFYTLEDSIGDEGFDGYDPKLHRYYAVYFPNRPHTESLYEKIRSKMQRDWKRATSDRVQLVDTWIFITPFDPDARLQGYAEKKQAQRKETTILLWGQTKLEELLNKYPHVKEEYFGEFGRINEAISEIALLANQEGASTELVFALLGICERNITEKLEEGKVYLLRNNFEAYARAMRSVTRVLAESGLQRVFDVVVHMQTFCVNILMLAHEKRPLFLILNEEILQTQSEVAKSNEEYMFLGVVNHLRAQVDVGITLSAIPGLGYLQQKCFGWWLLGALHVFGRRHHFGHVDLSELQRMDYFRNLKGQKVHARETFDINYKGAFTVAEQYRPDLVAFMKELHKLIVDSPPEESVTFGEGQATPLGGRQPPYKGRSGPDMELV